MNWQKHKQLYEPLNMSKLLYIAVEKWRDGSLAQAKTLSKIIKKRRPHLKLIQGKKDNNQTSTKIN